MRKYAKKLVLVSLISTMTILYGCSKEGDTKITTISPEITKEETLNTDPATVTPTQAPQETTNDPVAETTITATEKETTPEETVIFILLDDKKTTVTGDTNDHVFIEGNTVIIQKAGTYEFTGSLSDGQIRVEAGKDDKVELVLRGVSITSKTGACIYSLKADKTIIEVKNGTTNTFTDAKNYQLPSGVDEPNACIFAKGDLTIKGKGTLIVNGNYNNGITSKDDLKITNGIIQVNAAKNGIRGNDSITIKGASISVTSGKDAFKVSTEDKEDKGFFLMEDGEVFVTAGDDAIQAPKSVTLSGGTFTYKATGKKIKCDGTVDVKEGCLIPAN